MGSGLADAVDLDEALRRGGEHVGEAAETGQQCLGDGLGVAAGERLKQEQLEELVVLERVGPRLAEAGLQPFAMSEIMGLVPALVGGAGHQVLAARSRAESVKISTPVSVTPTECSNCADSDR